MSDSLPSTQSLSLVPKRLPGIIFVVTLFAYVVAVTQRSSLGVAGVEAAERFDSSATALSSLAVMQVVVYAVMQIPVGMMLDRFGATRLILAGALLMAGGQAIVAIAPTLEIAVLGRILVGMGDATTFVSGLRIIGAWFKPRRVPVLQQLFGTIGQTGQFLSAVPFAALLQVSGWVVAFLSVASVSLIVVVAALIALRDTPQRRFADQSISLRGAFVKLGDAFSRPGTRLGFWSHFTTQFPGNVFGLLWGFPLMVQGLGYDPGVAAVLLVVPVVAGMILGPALGILTARYPLRRSTLVIAASLAVTAAWIIAILWPGEPPFWYILITLIVMGGATTGSNIGFDFARTFNPAASYGSASGIVNVGGFMASGLTFLLMGMGIDFANRSTGGETTWASFQLAVWAIPLVTVIGLTGILAERRKTRTRMAAEEGVVVAPLWTALVRKRRRKQ